RSGGRNFWPAGELKSSRGRIGRVAAPGRSFSTDSAYGRGGPMETSTQHSDNETPVLEIFSDYI
ncbi:MAG: hypothetical protein ACLFTV_07810, partial [Desulfococcaceae bacterium]